MTTNYDTLYNKHDRIIQIVRNNKDITTQLSQLVDIINCKFRLESGSYVCKSTFTDAYVAIQDPIYSKTELVIKKEYFLDALGKTQEDMETEISVKLDKMLNELKEI